MSKTKSLEIMAEIILKLEAIKKRELRLEKLKRILEK